MNITNGPREGDKRSNGAGTASSSNLILMEPKSENSCLTGPVFESSSV
jgi:hypothetical protein